MSDGSRIWNRAWYGPVSSARYWLITRAVLALAAIDTWLLMIPRGGRYGAGGFNVAHFAWIDSLFPVPTPRAYVGTILLSGFLAALGATGVLRRPGLLLLTAVYSASWMMSQLDSYQHHYFLTWVFLCIALGPHLAARDAFAPTPAEPRTIQAWSFKLFAAIGAVLYAYTAVSKTEPEWRSGEVLIRINDSEGKLEPFRHFANNLGIDDGSFWTLMGHSVVLVQIVIALAYLSYVLYGERASSPVRAMRYIGLFAALSFHAGAEYFGLRIGWFSYYMFVMTLGFFLPDVAVRGVGWALTWPWRALMGRVLPEGLDDGPPRAPASVAVAVATLALVCGVIVVLLAPALDLPGADWAPAAAALIVAGVGAVRLVRRGARATTAAALGAAIAAAALFVAVEASDARYDYYRFIGGDSSRRGELRAAQEAYGYANTYAPEDASRFKKVLDIRRRMAREHRAGLPPR
ncbi:MAG: HTTM domain-containing protein [Myxococcota bacterium]